MTQTNSISRQTADFALCEFVSVLQLTEEQKEELRSLLEDRYGVSSSKRIPVLLDRVRDLLY